MKKTHNIDTNLSACVLESELQNLQDQSNTFTQEENMLAGTLYLYCTVSDNQVLTIMIYQLLGISVQQ